MKEQEKFYSTLNYAICGFGLGLILILVFVIVMAVLSFIFYYNPNTWDTAPLGVVLWVTIIMFLIGYILLKRLK